MKATARMLRMTRPSLLKMIWSDLGVRAPKADWYWLVERMAWVVQAEELPEMGEMVKRTNYGVKRLSAQIFGAVADWRQSKGGKRQDVSGQVPK